MSCKDITERLRKTMQQNSRSETEQRRLCVVNPTGPELGHLHEQISAEAMTLAQTNEGPSSLLRALGALSLYGLCDMAAEAHHFATLEKLAEASIIDLSRRSPIFLYKKRLIVAPVGALDTAALQRILDRVVSAIQQHRVKKILLYPASLAVSVELFQDWMRQLQEEATAARVKVKVLSDESPVR